MENLLKKIDKFICKPEPSVETNLDFTVKGDKLPSRKEPDLNHLEGFINLNALTKPLECKACKLTFHSNLDYGLHSKQHTDDCWYSCHMCEFRRYSKELIEDHIKRHDTFKCKKCNKIIKDRQCVYKHSQSHLLPQVRVPCELCGKTFSSPICLKTHVQEAHTAPNFNCTKCNKQFKRKFDLKRHCSSDHKEMGIDTSLLCDICGKKISCLSRFKEHVRTHTGDKPFSCTVCKRKFNTKNTLNGHMRIHTKERPFVCIYCGKQFSHESNYRYHIKIHTGEKPWSCSICSRGFISKANMKLHLKTCTVRAKASSKIVNGRSGKPPTKRNRSLMTKLVTDCEKTDPTFYVKEKKKRKLRIKDEVIDKCPLDKFINLNEVKLPLKCTSCNSTFNTSEDFVLHSKEHTEDGFYSCHLCEYRKNSKKLIKNHIKRHDTFKCKKCKKIFKSRQCAYKHSKSHLPQVPVPCEVCGKTFTNPKYLKRHHQVVHTEDTIDTAPIFFKCTKCNKQYKHAAGLKGHCSSKHREMGIDTSVICDICGKRLSCNAKLKQHVRIHTGDKPFSCTVCPRKFISKDILRAHMRVHTGEKPYVCMYCGKKFSHGAPYRYHIKTHTGEKSWSCVLCAKGFISKANMKIHLKTCTVPAK